jgi:hypothetical protein
VTIGVIAAFAWDSLSFTRLDAMVLGPLPLRGRTVIAAKLTAMALFLLAAAAAINIMTAVPFAMIASGHKAVASAGRHMVAHMVATMCAATFVFCAFVTLRAIFGLVSGGRAAIASLVQFGLVSALLCFIVFVPTAVQVVPVARVGRRVVQFAVRQQPIPAWSPPTGSSDCMKSFADRVMVNSIEPPCRLSCSPSLSCSSDPHDVRWLSPAASARADAGGLHRNGRRGAHPVRHRQLPHETRPDGRPFRTSC